MLKKILIALAIVLTTTLSTFNFYSNPVFADDPTAAEDGDSTGSSSNKFGITSNCNSFLGFTPWSCNVNIESTDTLKTGVWQIAANVLTDLTVAAAYLVLGYVIYGGYVYITSSGDPNKVAKGKKTLSQAFIGLAIVMSASIIMGSIRIALVGGSGNIGNCLDANSCANQGDMITSLVNWVIGIAGVVAVIFVVYGGISYTTSAGDPSKLKQAKNMIIYALIGLAIVALAEIITAFVTNTIKNSQDTSLINETIISKEVTYENKIN